MEITLTDDVAQLVRKELELGQYKSDHELVNKAVSYFFESAQESDDDFMEQVFADSMRDFEEGKMKVSDDWDALVARRKSLLNE